MRYLCGAAGVADGQLESLTANVLLAGSSAGATSNHRMRGSVALAIIARCENCYVANTRVSIIIPSYNRPHLLPRAVISALMECPESGEVIVVDDSSLSPAAKALRIIQDPRLRVVSNTGPHGAAGARNYGVATATGEVAFFLDDDDEYVFGYVADVVAQLEAGCVAAYGFSSTVKIAPDRDVELQPRKPPPPGLMAGTISPRHKLAAASAGLWVLRKDFLAVGGFDPSQTVDEDTDLCLKLLLAGHTPWYSRRIGTIRHQEHTGIESSGAQLTQGIARDRHAECYLRTYQTAASSLSPSSPLRRFLATRYIRRLAKAGAIGNAWVFAKRQQPIAFRLVLLGYTAFCALSVGLRRSRRA